MARGKGVVMIGTDAAPGFKGGRLVWKDVVVENPFLAVASDHGNKDHSI